MTEKQTRVERLARLLCEAAYLDPDAPVILGHPMMVSTTVTNQVAHFAQPDKVVPCWYLYANMAKTALEFAMNEHGL